MVLEKKFYAIVKADIFNEVSVVYAYFKKGAGEEKLRLFPACLLQHFTHPGLENYASVESSENIFCSRVKFSAGIR